VIIPLIQFGSVRDDHFRGSRGQGDNLEDILAKKATKKEVRNGVLFNIA
jgi:hypothetical protein